MKVIGSADGFPPGFYNVTAPKWCRHKEQYVTTTVVVGAQARTIRMVCGNCAADTGTLVQDNRLYESAPMANDALLKMARDALLKIEKVGVVSETTAP